jgi:hypothetical protein
MYCVAHQWSAKQFWHPMSRVLSKTLGLLITTMSVMSTLIRVGDTVVWMTYWVRAVGEVDHV